MTHSNGSFSGESFGFDSNGNRNTAGTYTYATGTGNRTSSDGTNTYAYDAEGNLASRTVISSGNQTLYTWDQRNRLTFVDSKISGVTTRIATYTYDAMDRRIVATSGGTTTATLYDGRAAVLDFDGSGIQVARYLQGPAVDEVLAREVAGTVGWYLQDRLGTVRDIASNAGAIVDHIDYNAFGAVVAESASSFGDRWKFTGRELDAATGLYYYRARSYDAGLGKFVSGDPIKFAGGDANLYRYAGNEPANSTDPSGNGAFGAIKGPVNDPLNPFPPGFPTNSLPGPPLPPGAPNSPLFVGPHPPWYIGPNWPNWIGNNPPSMRPQPTRPGIPSCPPAKDPGRIPPNIPDADPIDTPDVPPIRARPYIPPTDVTGPLTNPPPPYNDDYYKEIEARFAAATFPDEPDPKAIEEYIRTHPRP